MSVVRPAPSNEPELRVTEAQLTVPTLELAELRPDGYISTSDLIVELGRIFHPSGQDAAILDSRSDTYFSQKVRNMISHRTTPGSFIAQGLAEYTGDGIRITDAGRAFLEGAS